MTDKLCVNSEENYIYFAFHIEHDMMPSIVKIGGTKNWNKRIDQYEKQNISYFVICQTDKDFLQIERDIRKLYFDKRIIREHYKYHYGMIEEIISGFKLKFLCVAVPTLKKEYDYIYDYMEFKEPIFTSEKVKEKDIVKVEQIEIISFNDIPDITFKESIAIEQKIIDGRETVNIDDKLALNKYQFKEKVKLKEIIVDDKWTENQSNEMFHKVEDELFNIYSRGDIDKFSLHKHIDDPYFKGSMLSETNNNPYTISGTYSQVIAFEQLRKALGLKSICDCETVITRDKIMENKDLVIQCAEMLQLKPLRPDGIIKGFGDCIRRYTRIFSIECMGSHKNEYQKFKLKPINKILSHVDLWDSIT